MPAKKSKDTGAGAELGLRAADIMMKAAAEYCHTHGRADRTNPLTDAERAAIVAALRKRAGDAVKIALADARAALDAHMPDAAELTFKLTLVNAGIAAAKEVLEGA
jgi:hypothetical protein